MSAVGIIGGSGLYNIDGLILKKKKAVKTPFGKPSDHYTLAELKGRNIVFLPRHGSRHSLPPHMINYRANIYGFKKLGVNRIISVSAVGGIRKGLRPGDIVLLDQIIDMTRNRKSTFYNGDEGVVHIDFTEPYCPEMRGVILKAARKTGVKVRSRGTYIAVEGPRLETASEIRAFNKIGADVVGMTGMPEASLARELEICLAALSVVANYAAGISKKKLTTTEVMDVMDATMEKLRRLLKEILHLLPAQRSCPCKEALKDARI